MPESKPYFDLCVERSRGGKSYNVRLGRAWFNDGERPSITGSMNSAPMPGDAVRLFAPDGQAALGLDFQSWRVYTPIGDEAYMHEVGNAFYNPTDKRENFRLTFSSVPLEHRFAMFPLAAHDAAEVGAD